jgi:hypothetical protein
MSGWRVVCCTRTRALENELRRFLLLRSSWDRRMRAESREAINWQAQRVASACTRALGTRESFAAPGSLRGAGLRLERLS